LRIESGGCMRNEVNEGFVMIRLKREQGLWEQKKHLYVIVVAQIGSVSFLRSF